VALDDRYANKFAPLDSTAIYPKPGHKLLYTSMTSEMKCPTNILLPCAFHFISSIIDATHAPTNHKWYNPLYIITWPYWFIDLDFTCSSPLRWSIGPTSCSSFTVIRGPSLQSFRLAFHTCNRSIELSHVLIISTLITWLNVMSHVQWAPSSHVWALQHVRAIFTVMAYVTHTHILVD
jgi:hypothetical protein